MTQPRWPNKPISQELADLLAFRIVKRVQRVRRRGSLVCWEATTCINPVTGYSTIALRVDGRTRYYLRHRVMYTHYNGPFPPELTIDHLCENQRCCNPAHLRAAPHVENVLRSKTNPFAIHAQQKTCVQGHPLPARTLTESTTRKCPECKQGSSRRRQKLGLPPQDGRHGTLNGYTNWACRCDECKSSARSRYLRKRSEQIITAEEVSCADQV